MKWHKRKKRTNWKFREDLVQYPFCPIEIESGEFTGSIFYFTETKLTPSGEVDLNWEPVDLAESTQTNPKGFVKTIYAIFEDVLHDVEGHSLASGSNSNGE